MLKQMTSIAVVLVLIACAPQGGQAPARDSVAAAPAAGSDAWKIEAYSSAAPAALASGATVMDWDEAGKAQTRELRKGTNGWVCLPFNPPVPGGYAKAVDAAPICGDQTVMAWAAAYGSNTPPKLTTIGLAYMLHGDQGASNTDPRAMSSTPDNDWVVVGPHVMVFPVDPKSLDGMSADHNGGGPFVMWRGTPYAHVMVPVASSH